MSVFTPITPDQLTAWLRQYSLGSLVSMAGIAEGVENTNYFVTTTHGRYVLTLFERIAAVELPFYLNLLAHLARHGIPCPAPIARLDNDYLGTLAGKPAVVVTRLDGACVETPTVGHCTAVGAMLADLHIAGQSYGGHLANPRGARWWRETAPRVLPGLDADAAALLREELRFQGRNGLNDLPRGVIHADLFRDNVLFTDDGRISGILDFYFAGADHLLLDVAITVNDWCVLPDGGLDPARTQALLAAYHATRPLTVAEHAAWPGLLRAAALRFWLSRLADGLAPRPGEIVKRKDPDEFRAILLHRIDAGTDLPWIA